MPVGVVGLPYTLERKTRQRLRRLTRRFELYLIRRTRIVYGLGRLVRRRKRYRISSSCGINLYASLGCREEVHTALRIIG